MKTFTELLENINSEDKKAEIYTKPDGKKGTRMVPVDKEVIKQEKTLEWLKSALAREAKATKPREDDLDEAYNMENMCCKNCGDMFGKPTKENKSCQYDAYEPKGKNWIKAEKQHEKVECPKCKGKGCDHCDNKGYHTEAKEDVKELTIADVQKATAMAKKRQEKEREAGKKSVSTADLAARMPKKEAHNPKHVKQAVGIASDPRYKGGNMTGATKVINKLSKGLSDHPQVKAVLKRQNEGVKTFAEISKSMAGRYIKKAQVSTADAAKSTERGYTDSRSPDRDIAKAGKAQAKKGIKTFINRNKGTSTAVNKLTGKAKVPAKESNVRESLEEAKDKHNFTSAQHKAAADYHSKMAMAHHSAGTAHRMKHDEANNHHVKAQTAHADAYSFHNSAAAHKAGDKDESSRSVELAHKYSKKANRMSANRKGTDIKVSDHWNTNKGKDHGSEGKPKSHPYGEKVPD